MLLAYNKEIKTGRYESTKKAFNKAYASFIFKIAHQLVELSKVKAYIKQYLTSILYFLTYIGIPEWQDYQKGELKAFMEKERMKLGEPRDRHDEEEPEDDPDQIKKLSSHFQEEKKNQEGEDIEDAIEAVDNDHE